MSIVLLLLKLQCDLTADKVLPWLTIDTLNALVEHCPQLDKIERLDTWNISKTNLDEFYAKCKENNWIVDIN